MRSGCTHVSPTGTGLAVPKSRSGQAPENTQHPARDRRAGRPGSGQPSSEPPHGFPPSARSRVGGGGASRAASQPSPVNGMQTHFAVIPQNGCPNQLPKRFLFREYLNQATGATVQPSSRLVNRLAFEGESRMTLAS